jgi:hypothetical protein
LPYHAAEYARISADGNPAAIENAIARFREKRPAAFHSEPLTFDGAPRVIRALSNAPRGWGPQRYSRKISAAGSSRAVSVPG